MSRLTDLPAAALEFLIGFLLPLILPRNGGDTTAAKTLALQLLDDHQPRSVHELRLAAEAVAFSLKSLTVLAASAEPDLAAEKQEAALKWATVLSRSGHLAQRRLDELQRPRKSARQQDAAPDTTAPDTAAPDTAAPDTAAPDTAAPGTTAPDTTAPDTAAPQSAPPHVVSPPHHAVAPDSVAQAEATLQSAEKLLVLMRAHHKGAPPPHSPAAQQIQAQQRVVDTARMKLQQLRKQLAVTASSPEPARIAA